MLYSFRTHTGQLFTGAIVQEAFNKVANDWEQLAKDIRMENKYADHVSDEEKDNVLNRMLETADKIRAGEVTSYTISQRINKELTGLYIALLS